MLILLFFFSTKLLLIYPILHLSLSQFLSLHKHVFEEFLNYYYYNNNNT